MTALRWIWASTFIWFMEPAPEKIVPWRFWTRLILWVPVVWLVIVPICGFFAMSSVVGMFVYDFLFQFHILREREKA